MTNDVEFWRKPSTPWMCARRLFGPERPENNKAAPAEEHGALLALSLARTVIGFCISAMIYDHFRAEDQATSDWVSSIVYTLFISIGLTIFLSIIIAVFNRDPSREALQPLGRAVLALLVVGGFTLLDHFRHEGTPFGSLSGAPLGEVVRVALRMTLGLVAGIAFIWYIPFLWTSMVYWYLYPFGSSRKFPLLGPSITGITVFSVTVISFISGDGGPLPILPWIGITLSGLFTSLALVGAEVFALKRAAADETIRQRAESARQRDRRSP